MQPGEIQRDTIIYPVFQLTHAREVQHANDSLTGNITLFQLTHAREVQHLRPSLFSKTPRPFNSRTRVKCNYTALKTLERFVIFFQLTHAREVQQRF